MNENKKYLLFLSLFGIIYLFALNINWNTDLVYDEGRHTIQGIFFHDYVRTIFQEGYRPLISFLDDYSGRVFSIDWFAMYDPPAHALWQALIFFVLGISTFTARFANQLLVICSIFFFYFLSKKIFNNGKQALFTTILFLLSPFTYYYARQAMMEIPIALFTAGWFYFFFYGKGWKSIFLGGGCLIFASLMKYHTLLFVGIFLALYVLYLFYVENKVRKEKITFTWLKQQQSFMYARNFAMQVLAFIVIATPWLLFSWRQESLAFEKMFTAGVIEGSEQVVTLSHGIYFVLATFKENWFITLFALVPFIFWRGHKDFLKENVHMILFIVTTLVIATLLINNRQFRYVIQVLPLIYIFTAKGIFALKEKIGNDILKKVFFAVVLLLSVTACVYTNITAALELGEADTDLWTVLQSIPEPRYFVYKDAGGSQQLADGTRYFYFNDLFLFQILQHMPERNPLQQYTFLRYQFFIPFKDYKEQLALFRERTNMAVIFAKPYAQSEEGKEAGLFFEKNSFEKKEVRYYDIYFTINDTLPVEDPHVFNRISMWLKAEELNKQANQLGGERRYREAIPVYEEAITFNPEGVRIFENLIKVRNLYVEQLMKEKKYADAQKELEKNLAMDPRNEKTNKLLRLLRNGTIS